jgi:hypothetical protein
LQASEILPNLADACFVAFRDEILGLESLHQAINYYQIAVVQAQTELQNRFRLELGKVYLELMYYDEESKNAQLAIDCFESVLHKSKDERERREASNGKSQGWFWMLVTEEGRKSYSRNEEFPFRKWAKSIASTYRDDATAVSYYLLSNWWLPVVLTEDVPWFQLAWSLFQGKRQAPPPVFHYRCFFTLFSVVLGRKEKGRGFWDLPILLSALEHLALFAKTVTLKDFYIIYRLVKTIPNPISVAYRINPKKTQHRKDPPFSPRCTGVGGLERNGYR